MDLSTNHKNSHEINKNLIKRNIFVLKFILLSVGRPFFFVLSRIVIATLFVVYITGYTTRKIINALIRIVYSTSLNLFTSFKVITKKLGKVKFKKRVKRTKLFFLKLRLTGLRRLKVKHKKIKRPSVFLKYSLFSLIFFSISISAVFYFLIIKNLPSPQKLSERKIEISTKIYDRNGILLYNIYKDKNRSFVAIEEIPDTVKYATLAAEDAEFYTHPGFSIKGITRAIIKNLKEGKETGGSTITQQLVKNTLLTPEKTIVRKLKELYLSINVERVFSKDKILEMYLNEVSYGGTAYGIQEASRTYFGKNITHLTLAESAFLAGLPKSPTKFSPYGSNIEASLSRQRDVLFLMKVNGFISESQKKKALSQELKFEDNKTDIKAPHFVMYTRQILEENFGKEIVEAGGLSVKTTLDYHIQTLAEKVVREEIEKLENLNVTNGSVVILDPKTGEILAMVGSKDYFDLENDGNVNVTIRERQPGSSIKPVNYAYALSNGLTPLSIIDDSPVRFVLPGSDYTPQNYDGAYIGKTTLRNALAQSRNIPAVKVLYDFGVENMIEMGKKMGITTWDEHGRFGLSLTLGGGETKLIDLAVVYSTFANYGVRLDLTPLISVTDHIGNVYYKNNCQINEERNIQYALEKIFKLKVLAEEEKIAIKTITKNCSGNQVLDPRVAFLITDILRDNNARAPQFGTNSALVIPNHPEVAVKTGTSNNLRDNLTIGYNQDYVIAVWVGNNDNSSMARVASGVTGASPIFNRITSQLLAFEPARNWEIPAGLTRLSVCSQTGTLSCSSCNGNEEWFLVENQPIGHCVDTQEHLTKTSQEEVSN